MSKKKFLRGGRDLKEMHGDAVFCLELAVVASLLFTLLLFCACFGVHDLAILVPVAWLLFSTIYTGLATMLCNDAGIYLIDFLPVSDPFPYSLLAEIAFIPMGIIPMFISGVRRTKAMAECQIADEEKRKFVKEILTTINTRSATGRFPLEAIQMLNQMCRRKKKKVEFTVGADGTLILCRHDGKCVELPQVMKIYTAERKQRKWLHLMLRAETAINETSYLLGLVELKLRPDGKCKVTIYASCACENGHRQYPDLPKATLKWPITRGCKLTISKLLRGRKADWAILKIIELLSRLDPGFVPDEVVDNPQQFFPWRLIENDQSE